MVAVSRKGEASLAQIAKDFGISESCVQRWVHLADVEDGARPGVTLVERTTRFTMLIHLPREKGYGTTPRVTDGPPLAGYGAITMKNRLAEAMTTLPDHYDGR